MSFMTSPKSQFTPGDNAYVPFWVLLEFIDIAPPDPFIKGRIVSINLRRMNSPDGQVQLLACDFEIKPDLIASGIPLEYLIPEDELCAWADRIGDWFKNYSRQADL